MTLAKRLNMTGNGSKTAAQRERGSADGYTLFVTNLSNAINATLYEKTQLQLHARHAAVGGTFF
jgi:hypothetical protein